MTRKIKYLALLAAIYLTAPATYANTNVCLDHTVNTWNVPKSLLLAVHHVEHGKPGLVSRRNKNGTYDMGPMQFNTSTAADLKKYGVEKDQLLNSECVSFYVAGWKLATSAHQFGNWELAVAAYNCGDGCVGDAIKKLKKTNTAFNSILQLDIPPKTKMEYVPNVMDAWKRFEN